MANELGAKNSCGVSTVRSRVDSAEKAPRRGPANVLDQSPGGLRVTGRVEPGGLAQMNQGQRGAAPLAVVPAELVVEVGALRGQPLQRFEVQPLRPGMVSLLAGV